jgi:hypothetical protein
MSKTIRIEYYGIEGEGPTVKEAKAAERDHHVFRRAQRARCGSLIKRRVSPHFIR